MNAIFPISAISLLACLSVFAQKTLPEPVSEEVLEAIREFNRKDGINPAKDVVVVLEPPSDAQEAPADSKADQASPVLVTGKNPSDSTEKGAEPADADEPADTDDPAADSESPPAPAGEATEEAEPEEAEPEGVAVRVEKLRTRAGTIDPSQVTLLAPFPAKPLSQPPAGWILSASDDVPPLSREVELAPGARITLQIRPHLLLPDADGHQVFAVPEPGFEPSGGYDQAATIGAVLSTSVRDLDEQSKQMGEAIDRLQQLLVSLPKPDAAAEPPATKPSPKR